MSAVLGWLRRRWYVVVVLAIVALWLVWFGAGVIRDTAERKAARGRIETSAREAKELAEQVRDQNARIEEQNATILRIAAAIDSATSPEARSASAATLAGAIAQLQRSIDCTAFYFAGERPSPCAEVIGRLDALRRGVDPFLRPPTGAP